MSMVVIYGSEGMCSDVSFCFVVDLGIWEKAACRIFFFFLNLCSLRCLKRLWSYCAIVEKE